ncbi:DUF559 domain-containing protein [Microbacterium sp. H1-D42]|uniref:endonuclease domain-containing protein n=1 Tax=Microbacterium sp. H1-D42 TaxID=2925844 RepID=UPI001F539685|nr:DUF559 domain-containing protein [Microbacterium sp. H1-D42]UNK69876.1 type IV toxin-antitoxin system AbiEi family antitoxin domain-containing protein [Microbacterium sp. H1-D42]
MHGRRVRFLLHSLRIVAGCPQSRDFRREQDATLVRVDAMLSASDTIDRLGGIARSAQLYGLGFDRRSLATCVAKGEIRRLRPGVFGALSLPGDLRTAAQHGGALTCVSVLRRAGVWTVSESDVPHVWLGPGRHSSAHVGCQCIDHYQKGRPPIGAASLVTALLHFRQCEGDEEFFAAFESAWSKGLLSRSERAAVRAGLPMSARWLVDLARPDADSGLESLLRLRLHILGIQLQCQVKIDGVGRVDFAVADRLIIEVDGKENHDGHSMRHKDLVRDAAASALGYETLRFDYAQVLHDWETVQRAIVGALLRLKVHA